MHWIGFLKLIKSFYRAEPPDIAGIQKQGLLAVKIAQTFALRIDFLSEETCKALAQLYTQTTPIPAENAHALLKAYVKPDWFKHFSTIESTPIASASIGQVHRGILNNGDAVVIKFIKKEYTQKFIKDINRLRRFFRLLLFLYPKLEKVADPLGILQHIQQYTVAELDLQNEIRNRVILETIYSDHKTSFDLSRLRFPKLYPHLSNQNVLVSEYIEGSTLDSLLESKSLDYNALLELFHIHGFYMFIIGTFHGDLHPGNVIYKDGMLYLIDTGALSTVDSKTQKGLFSFMEALSKDDYEGCAYHLNQMAKTEIHGVLYQQFRKELKVLYRDFSGSTVSQISLTKRMMETIKLGVNTGMVFEKGIYPIIKSLMYLDGMVLRCNPNAVLMKDMQRFIEEFQQAKSYQ